MRRSWLEGILFTWHLAWFVWKCTILEMNCLAGSTSKLAAAGQVSQGYCSRWKVDLLCGFVDFFQSNASVSVGLHRVQND